MESAPQRHRSTFRDRLVRYVVVVAVVTVVAAVAGGAYVNVNLPGDPEGDGFAWVSALVWGAMGLFMAILGVGAYEVFRTGREEPGAG